MLLKEKAFLRASFKSLDLGNILYTCKVLEIKSKQVKIKVVFTARSLLSE